MTCTSQDEVLNLKKKKSKFFAFYTGKKKKQNTNFCVLIGQMQKVMRYLRQDQCKKSEIHKCYSALSDTCSPIKSRTPKASAEMSC